MLSTDLVGQLLDGKWQIKSRLGVGGMGTVFLAEDVTLEREVAVKFLSATLSGDADANARFEREAKVMARLDHPNLVPIYAFGRHAGAAYMVMKYVPGEPLSVRAKAGLTLGEVTALVAQLCDGLSHLHRHGILHRDIKPSNIIIGEGAHVTLLDFGVARPRAGVPMTPSGSAVGTPRYMAPEQVLGKECDQRVDLYAVGVLLFELTTGAGLFPGKGDVELMRAHVEDPTPDPRTLNPKLSIPLAGVIARALAKNPAERFDSAAQLKAALLAADPLSPKSAEPVAATPEPPAAARVRHTEVLLSYEPLPPTTVEPSPVRASRRGAIALVPLFALMAGLAVWGWWPQAPPPPVEALVAVDAGAPEPAAPDAAVEAPAPVAEVVDAGPAPENEPRAPASRPKPVEVRVVASVGGKSSKGWIDVDGVRIERPAPTTVDLLPGRHTIRILRDGFKPSLEEIKVSPGKPMSVTVELKP